jgi:hypothetical protein
LATLGLGLLAAALINLVSASSAAPPVDPAHMPLVGEGPTDRVALNGAWVVARDPADQGEAQGWPAGNFPGQQVRVPYVVNATPITGPGGVTNYKGSIAWFRTSFSVARAGVYALRFESVNYRARVWLDGKRLGGHSGEYLPFELRFRTTAGAHTLVVRDDYRSPDLMAREGFHRTWFNFGGINREVTLRPIGDSELINPTLQTRLAPASDGSVAAIVNVDVYVRNNGGQRAIAVTGTLANGDHTINLAFPSVTLAPGRSTLVHALATVENPALWAPGHPSLYDLDLKVGDESEYRARVGLRQIESYGGRLYLNGKRRRSARAPRRGRHRRLAGNRPGRLARQLELGRQAPDAARRAARAVDRPPGAAAPVDHRLEPRQRGRRQRASRWPDPLHRGDRRSTAPARPGATRGGRRLGPAPTAPGRADVRQRRRDRRDELPRLV